VEFLAARRRFKFHFDGVTPPEEERSVVEAPEKLTSDDILHSLQRRSGGYGSLDDELEELASSSQKGDEMVEAPEYVEDDATVLQTSPVLHYAIMKARERSHRLGLGLLVLTGLVIVGLYESIVRYSDPLYVVGRLSSVNVNSMVVNPFQLIVISLIGIVALALMMRHHRNILSKTSLRT
jgi:hypothetical protein